MNETGQVPGPVGSLDELLAVALAMEHESALRYHALAALMQAQGHPAPAAQFEALATMEERHALDVTARSQTLLGRVPDPTRVRWSLPAGLAADEARAAPLSAYQALALAVRNEERAFAFYTYVAAETEVPDVRILAEALARDELQHAEILRHHRRRAFHAERPIPVEIPETVEALLGMARSWDGEAAAAHALLASNLYEAGDIEGAAMFRRLSEREAAAGVSGVGTASPLRDAADGLRLVEAAFDRYALIAERATDEFVVIEAQRLAGEVVERLAMTGGARRTAVTGI
jgi:rubrerythrin